MKRLANTLIVLVIAIGAIALYTLLHEGAHGIFAVILGGRLTTFNVNFLSGVPRIRYTGDLALWKKAIIALAGPMVPFIIWLMVIMRVKVTSNIIVKKIMLFFSISILGSFIPNIILPILYEGGANVQGEDIVNFIVYSKINSYLISTIMVLLVLLGYLVLCKRLDIKETIKEQIEVNIKKKAHQIGIIVAVIFTPIILVVSTVNVIPTLNTTSSFEVPKEYDKLISIKLDEKNYINSTIYELKVKEPRIYSFYSIGDSKEIISLSIESEINFIGLRKNELKLVDYNGKIQSNFMGWYLKEGEYSIKLSSTNNKGYLNMYIESKVAPNIKGGYFDEKIFKGELPELDSGYKLVANENLGNFGEKSIYQFTVDHDKTVQFSIFLTTKEGKATVKLSGDKIEDTLISEYQMYTDGRGSFLKKGKYEITLTSEGCHGKIYLFINH